MKENSIENLQNKKYFNNIDEAIKVYEEFRRFKNDGFIESIDTDFFFNLTDIILSDYKRVLKENEELTISNKEIDKECSRLEEKEVKLINENEHYKDLIYALETYYDITEEDFEIVQKQDEIDIDSIEEIKLRPSDREHLSFGGLIFEEKINKLVQAVKQLNKEVKELKKI